MSLACFCCAVSVVFSVTQLSVPVIRMQSVIQGHCLWGEPNTRTPPPQSLCLVTICLSNTCMQVASLAKQAISHWAVIGWAELNRGRQRGHDTQQIRLNGAFKQGQRGGNPIESTQHLPKTFYFCFRSTYTNQRRCINRVAFNDTFAFSIST